MHTDSSWTHQVLRGRAASMGRVFRIEELALGAVSSCAHVGQNQVPALYFRYSSPNAVSSTTDSFPARQSCNGIRIRKIKSHRGLPNARIPPATTHDPNT